MHERNRRTLCRLAFLALCVLPTCGTLSWAGYRLSPWHAAAEKAAWERMLFERTGLLASVARVDHPGGSSTLLVGVELTDPDGGDRVVNIRQAEFAPAPQGLVVLLSQPEVSRGKFERLCDTLHDRVLRGPQPEQAIQITSGELTLEVGGRAQTFTLLRCTISPHETGVRTLIDFQIAGLDMPAPAQLQVDRNRQTDPPSTRWQLLTQTPIPCSLFADYLPSLRRLGTRCTFQGTVEAIGMRGEWTAEYSGQLSQVDLAVATESFPHRLSGLANVSVQKAVIRGSRLIEATGAVAGDGGTVSTSLLESLAEQMQLAIPGGTARLPEPYVTYDQLAFGFALSADGVALQGHCPGVAPSVMMRSRGNELLAGDPGRSYTLAAAVRALAPGSDTLVPATGASQQLIGVLALPAGRIATESVARDPRVRVRMRQP